jgi:hypothetical protein
MSEPSERAERFCRWFLRFNGYFSIENFIVHASDDPSRISNGLVAPVTETDLLAVRMPRSREIKGPLNVANFGPLTSHAGGKIDVIIGEVKTGDSRPNSVWKANGDRHAIEYMVRFVGLCSTDEEIAKVASELQTCFNSEREGARYRFIVFCKLPNKHYSKAGVQYISFAEMISFLVAVRGQSWITANIGVASVHYQWDPLIKDIFDVINRPEVDNEQKSTDVARLILE